MLAWLVTNWELLLGLVGAGLTLASLITRLTPSPKDDEVVRRLLAFLSILQPRDVGGAKLPLTPPREPPEPPLFRPRPERLDG